MEAKFIKRSKTETHKECNFMMLPKSQIYIKKAL